MGQKSLFLKKSFNITWYSVKSTNTYHACVLVQVFCADLQYAVINHKNLRSVGIRGGHSGQQQRYRAGALNEAHAIRSSNFFVYSFKTSLVSLIQHGGGWHSWAQRCTMVCFCRKAAMAHLTAPDFDVEALKKEEVHCHCQLLGFYFSRQATRNRLFCTENVDVITCSRIVNSDAQLSTVTQWLIPDS